MAFTVDSHTPQPYMRCYCSICRKTAGSGGFAINLGADFRTLDIKGKRSIGVYRAKGAEGDRGDSGESSLQRHFCRKCGSPLWCYDPHWPDLVHPHASAIDTPLPKPAEFVDMMLGSAAPCTALHEGDNVERFEDYPAESIEDWHRSRGLWMD